MLTTRIEIILVMLATHHTVVYNNITRIDTVSVLSPQPCSTTHIWVGTDLGRACGWGLTQTSFVLACLKCRVPAS